MALMRFTVNRGAGGIPGTGQIWTVSNRGRCQLPGGNIWVGWNPWPLFHKITIAA
jgi:hypothetical protein